MTRMAKLHDPRWVRWPVTTLAAMDAAWMTFDGTKALTTGDYTTAGGKLGPWANLVSAAGIEPRSTGMKVFFVTYGVCWLAAVLVYLVRPRIGRPLMVVAAAGSLWGLVFGTISSVLQLVLLALGRRARTAIG
jgi:hypothetical protein